MFPSRYFPNRMFAPRYWPKVGDTVVIVITFGRLEYTIPRHFLQYTVPSERMDYTLPKTMEETVGEP